MIVRTAAPLVRSTLRRPLAAAAALALLAACNLPNLPMPVFPGQTPANAAPVSPAKPSPIAGASPDVVVTQLTSTEGSDEWAPTLNADGSLLLFAQRDRPHDPAPATATPAKRGAKAFEAPKPEDKPAVMALDPTHPGAPSAQSVDGARAIDPAFLPSGSGYVYVSDVMGSWAIVRADSLAAGAAPALVTPASVREPKHPSVSPDGSQLAFGMKKGADSVVATSKLDGSHLSVLGAGAAPAFGPDGARLAFVRVVGGHAHVHTMDAATGRGLVALTNGEHEDASPSWSPDGTKVAFTSTRGAPDGGHKLANVYVVKADGTELKQLTQSKGEVRDLTWGRDGNIYFSADPDGSGQLDLFRMSIAGEKPAPSTAGALWSTVSSPFSRPAPSQAPLATSTPPAATACAASCAAGPSACPNLPCLCNDRRVVNTRQCDNACCAPPDVACAASCRKHSGYSGSLVGGGAPAPAGGAPDATPAPAPEPPKAAVGKTCKKDGECASNLCVFSGRAQYGYCTQECQNFPDCPTFWKCEGVRNGSGKYCVQDTK